MNNGSKSKLSEHLEGFLKRLNEEGKKHQAERDAVQGEDMIFTIPAYEMNTANEWIAEHKKTCRLYIHEDGTPVEFPGGAIGGGLTYSFTPNGIGVAMSVRCHCGESVNITDYDSW